jgi:hypothetical protein
LVPVARTVSGYSPGPSVPPLTDTVTAWLPFLLSTKLLGLTLTGPIPAGRTPFACGPPSIVRLTVPPKNVGFEFEVENVIVPVPVRPVEAIDTTSPAPLLVKSRATFPIATATG